MKQLFSLMILIFLLSGCAVLDNLMPKPKFDTTQYDVNYTAFAKKTNLKKSYKVYKNKSLLAFSDENNTHMEVDVSEQRARLMVHNAVAVDTPCTTGSKKKYEPHSKKHNDKSTPIGEHNITEKIQEKRSTIFGKIYNKEGKLIFNGDRREFDKKYAKQESLKKNIRYEGSSINHWMRLTNDGIGIHESRSVKRRPASNGCIRIPPKVAPLMFAKMRTGSKVVVKP